LPNDVEDGDSDLDDSIIKSYSCTVEVEYYRQCHGTATKTNEAQLTKKAPIPQGYPIAILSVPEEVLVGEEIIADGSASIAPERSYIANYKWQVEAKDLPNEEGKKIIKLKYDEPQTVTITLTIVDNNGKTDKSIKDVIVKKKETVKPPSNWCPDVSLTGPTLVMQGDSFTLNISAEDKEDGMLKPTLSKPSCLVLDSSVQNGRNRAKFTKEGTYTVTAKATDSGGKSDTDSIEIEVCPPKPFAVITEKGDYKIGQTVVLDSSKSQPVSRTYPIDWKLTKWKIKPLGDLTSSDIFYKKLNDRETAFTSKKTGEVEISLTVTNTLGYSNTRTIERTIIGDTPPKADFTLVEKVYRDKDNDRKAIVKAFDKSTSPDGDTITKRAWFYAFDSNNDGVFSNETWYYNNGTSWIDTKTTYDNIFSFADTIETGNLTDVAVETKKVGKYKFVLKVYEEHDNRLLEFIDMSYILTDDTEDKPAKECISEVDNIAPVTSVKVDISKDEVYDIVVATDYKDTDLMNLKTQINLLKSTAFANNKDFNVHMITDQKKIGEQKETKDYNSYARIIDLKYYFEKGFYQYANKDDDRDKEIDYHHDLQEEKIIYETTQGYTKPTIEFQKGDKVNWTTKTFSKKSENQHNSYELEGTEFQFYNPDNKAGTLVTHREYTDGWQQMLDGDYEFIACWLYHNIVIDDITVKVGDTWEYTNSTPHYFYHDINSIDFSDVKNIRYDKDSKKIFLCFIKGTDFDYKDSDKYDYEAAGIDNDLINYLKDNRFETYVIAPNDNIMDFKFDAKNYDSDIDTQEYTLRDLAHCSNVRGRSMIGNETSQNWKDHLLHITEKNALVPTGTKIDDNTITLTFDENFDEGDELKLSLIQQQYKLADQAGNQLDGAKIDYDIKVENDMKQLSSLYFSYPPYQEIVNDKVQVKKILPGIAIYEDDKGVTKFIITDEEDNRISDNIRELEGTSIKDVLILPHSIVVLKANGSVESSGYICKDGHYEYKLDSKWSNMKKIIYRRNVLYGLKKSGDVIRTGVYDSYGIGNIYYDNEYYKSNIVDMYTNRSYIHFIKEGDDMEDIDEIITNGQSELIYLKKGDKYYVSGKLMDLDYPVKQIIPVDYYEVLVIKPDNSFYVIEIDSRELQRENRYEDERVSDIYNVGKIKSIAMIRENNVWIQGTEDDFYLRNSYTDRTESRYIKIDDIDHIINSTTNDDIIIVMKNGKRHSFLNRDTYSNNYEKTMKELEIPSDAKNYFINNLGKGYMLQDNNYYSSITDYENKHYDYREDDYVYDTKKKNGKFDKIISDYNFAIYLKDGKADVEGGSRVQENFGSIASYDDIKDIIKIRVYDYYRILFIIRENYISYKREHKDDDFPEGLKNYNDFRKKDIVKYLVNVEKGTDISEDAEDNIHLYGLSKDGNLYRTDKSPGLKLIASKVQDIFRLEDEIIYLFEDGTLSKYGDGKKYEKYEGMFITPQFITLKLKGTDTKVSISKIGAQTDYIGKLREKVDYTMPLGKTQIHLGEHVNGGKKFMYKIFSKDENSIEEILYNQPIDRTWKEVKNLDLIQAEKDYYIGVVEVDIYDRVIRYSTMKAKSE
ncbi:PKD domain-containing protein, partial [Vallitalea longa]|uniref:PKD domain-containing protein n=1 Tax=Vallitalea longa TaxID=2936439 RepID=UPI002491F612